MDDLLNEINGVCERYHFDSLQQLIFSAQKISAEKKIEISIFGQFKAGKSSFINSLVGKPVLPIGVLPVTSVITKIRFGRQENVCIYFQDGSSKEIEPELIGEYVTEINNPDNIKGVDSALVELPELKHFRGLTFIDTPGIGSVFQSNTLVATENIATSVVAVVCISAERPMSAADLNLIRKLDANAYRVICLLTKTDLFTKEQLDEITSFLEKSLEENIGKEVPVYKYSVLNKTQFFKEKIQKDIFLPYLEKFNDEINNIFQYKIHKLAKNCVEYLEIAYNASVKTDNERASLKSEIFDEKTNMSFIREQLTSIATESKSRIRESVYHILEPYSQAIVSELRYDLTNDFSSWQGNLYKVTRQYEQWLKSTLSKKLAKIILEERKAFTDMMSEVNKRFGFFTQTWKERINDNVKKVLGIQLSLQDWEPEFKPISRPDISVYPAFDTPIDLLWFLFPMVLFRKIFRKYFLRQIPAEVNKNIYRTTSLISHIIFKQIDAYKEQTIDYIFKELNTIERTLSTGSNEKENLKKQIDSLTQKISVSFDHPKSV